MECQTCSTVFSNSTSLHSHVEFFQARARYLVDELMKCLAHTSPRSDEDTGDDNNLDDDCSKELDDSMEEEHNEYEYDDFRCPSNGCEQIREFATLKELQRHYAIHMFCYEVCKSCNRRFDRASTYLHHSCKKSSGHPRESVLRRRKALRGKVHNALNKAKSDEVNANTSHRYKRCKTGRSDVNELQTDLLDRSGYCATNGTDAPTSAQNMLSDLQPGSFPQVGDDSILESTDMFLERSLGPGTNAPELLHDICGPSPAPNFSAQKSSEFHSSQIQCGSKALAMYSDMTFGSKAPAMYSDGMYGSRIPSMYLDTVFGSKAPLMYSIPTYGESSLPDNNE